MYIQYADPLDNLHKGLREGGKQINEAVSDRRKRKRAQELIQKMSPGDQAIFGGFEDPDELGKAIIQLTNVRADEASAREGHDIQRDEYTLKKEKQDWEKEFFTGQEESKNKFKEDESKQGWEKINQGATGLTIQQQNADTNTGALGVKQLDSKIKQQDANTRTSELKRKVKKDQAEQDLYSSLTTTPEGSMTGLNPQTVQLLIEQQKMIRDMLHPGR